MASKEWANIRGQTIGGQTRALVGDTKFNHIGIKVIVDSAIDLKFLARYNVFFTLDIID